MILAKWCFIYVVLLPELDRSQGKGEMNHVFFSLNREPERAHSSKVNLFTSFCLECISVGKILSCIVWSLCFSPSVLEVCQYYAFRKCHVNCQSESLTNVITKPPRMVGTQIRQGRQDLCVRMWDVNPPPQVSSAEIPGLWARRKRCVNLWHRTIQRGEVGTIVLPPAWLIPRQISLKCSYVYVLGNNFTNVFWASVFIWLYIGFFYWKENSL